MGIWKNIFKGKAAEPSAVDTTEKIVATLQNAVWNGNKFYGGFGDTKVFTVDHQELRSKSLQLFRENMYARGAIRRLVTNEINTGLTVEVYPYEPALGVPVDSLSDWSEDIEIRFGLWAQTPAMCDYEGRRTFGEIQREARREALAGGDVLVVLHVDKDSLLPKVQLVSGGRVSSPWNAKEANGKKIVSGVELDPVNRSHVAYWVKNEKNEYDRIAAHGLESGRRVAWLMYGTDLLVDDVRGESLLSLVLQSLKDIDRYRDAATRKALINSILALFIEKTQDKMGTNPITGGAVLKSNATIADNTGENRTFGIADMIPGVFIEELQYGERPTPHSTSGTDVNFGPFEDAIIAAISWSMEMPPEILRLAFTKNYSASQAAINEFKIYLNLLWSRFGDEFCKPIYEQWLFGQVLSARVKAPGLADAMIESSMFEQRAAWLNTEWTGSVKPSTDILKQAKGYDMLVQSGFITRDKAARELTGTKFSTNVRRLAKENKMLADALEPLQMQADEPQTTDYIEDPNK